VNARYPDGRGNTYGRIQADDHGGTCREIIDLSNDHPHGWGKIAVGHVSAGSPLHERQPVHFEFIEARGLVDVRCGDCLSEVTWLEGAPACVAGAVAVRHADTCPRLAQLRRAS
jgi:hypothetical protein